MKKLIMAFVCLMALFGASAKENNDTTVCFKISPAMTCSNCENKIKSNLRFEKGVAAIEANAPGDEVRIRYNKTKTDSGKIEKAFGKIGYKASAQLAEGKSTECSSATVCSDKSSCTKGDACCAREKKNCKKECSKEGKTDCEKECSAKGTGNAK